MAPLALMLVGWVGFRTAGVFGFEAADSTLGALRFALVLMFGFTAVSHVVPRTRADFTRMVPPWLPAPAMLVTLTGVLELAGAVGLMVPDLIRPAAFALAALLAAMAPANVYAVRAGMEVAGRPASPLVWRLPLQLFWIGGLVAVGLAA